MQLMISGNALLSHPSLPVPSPPLALRTLSLSPAPHSSSRLTCRAAMTPELELESVAQSIEEEARPMRTPWHEKPCPGFSDSSSLAELMTAMTSGRSTGQFVAVEFYAGWCASCKGAFPALCKLPKDKELAKSVKFYKANIELDDSLFWWIKKHEVRALPYVVVFNPSGERIAGMSSSFKRMAQLKEGLHTIISQPLGTKFHLTPTGSLAVGSAVGDAAIPRIADQDEAVSML